MSDQIKITFHNPSGEDYEVSVDVDVANILKDTVDAFARRDFDDATLSEEEVAHVAGGGGSRERNYYLDVANIRPGFFNNWFKNAGKRKPGI